MEVHVLNKFDNDFYGEWLRIAVLGYIRPEKDYPSLDALVKDIHWDIEVAKRSDARPVYVKYQNHAFLQPCEQESECVQQEINN